MTVMASTAGCALAGIVSACLIGCGKPSDTVPIHGQVTYLEESLPSGSLTFFPASGRPESAVLSPSGGYTVSLAPGDYRVTVNVGAELPAGWKEGDPIPPPKIVLPPKYTTRVASTLTANVTEGLSDPIDFRLE